MFTVLLVQSYGLDKPLHRQVYPTAFFHWGNEEWEHVLIPVTPAHHGFPNLALLPCVPDGSTSVLSSYLSLMGAEEIGTNHLNLDSSTSCTTSDHGAILERLPLGCIKGQKMLAYSFDRHSNTHLQTALSYPCLFVSWPETNHSSP